MKLQQLLYEFDQSNEDDTTPLTPEQIKHVYFVVNNYAGRLDPQDRRAVDAFTKQPEQFKNLAKNIGPCPYKVMARRLLRLR